MAKRFVPDWDSTDHPARLWSVHGNSDKRTVQCHLSPRQCRIPEGGYGFCKVRKNVNGRLVSLNYGRAVQATKETIETEAVFHFAPGASILSLGNIGCMLHCRYCHNWRTSQAVHVDGEQIRQYTPEQIVDLALELDIPVLSWTYNDPVVWHEFVLDTAALAREAGLINLYKSAFYISEVAASELAEVVDIFSISLKTLNAKRFSKMTGGRVEPVLDATKLVYASGAHVEISMLMVTDMTDDVDEVRQCAEWISSELSQDTPLHLVRFHPDYKYTEVDRTPIERLEAGRRVALESGLNNVYLGNVLEHPAVNTYCRSCSALLVERRGLGARSPGLTSSGLCAACGTPSGITIPKETAGNGQTQERPPAQELSSYQFYWTHDVRLLHVRAIANGSPVEVRSSPLGVAGDDLVTSVPSNSELRFIVSRSSDEEKGVHLSWPSHAARVELYELLDRAHFPTDSTYTWPVDSAPSRDAHSLAPGP